MNTVRQHPILSKRVWSHEAGLTSVQWVGLSAVALVAIVVIVGVFASGGSQEIQQAASTGTDRRIDCLYNNCQPWENDSSGPRAAAGAGVVSLEKRSLRTWRNVTRMTTTIVLYTGR